MKKAEVAINGVRKGVYDIILRWVEGDSYNICEVEFYIVDESRQYGNNWKIKKISVIDFNSGDMIDIDYDDKRKIYQEIDSYLLDTEWDIYRFLHKGKVGDVKDIQVGDGGGLYDDELESDLEEKMSKIMDSVDEYRGKLILMRGLPGSGKSYKAHELGGEVYSTDDFFTISDGYKFSGAMLSIAHLWNKIRVKNAMERGVEQIIVDNTNLDEKSIKPYIELCKKYGYDIEIVEPDTPWKYDINELSKRNTHNVSKETLERMLNKLKNTNIEDIIKDNKKKNEYTVSIYKVTPHVSFAKVIENGDSIISGILIKKDDSGNVSIHFPENININKNINIKKIEEMILDEIKK